MAQPLADVPSFCLCVYGTNSKFNANQVESRWNWMQQEALKYGVIISGFSSDGDEKLLLPMKRKTFRGEGSVLPGWESFFFAPMDVDDPPLDETVLIPLCTQDIIHIGAKMKTQCLKSKSDLAFMPMGTFVVSGTFLEVLVKEESFKKEDHGLCISDLDVKDKMNFRSVQKITDDRVLEALKNIPGAQGTRVYLTILCGILDSFLSKDLPVYKRVYLMWKSVFLLRCWRQWLQSEKDYSETRNFISRNCYECIEICAHALINIIRRLRIYHKPHLFRPYLMGSQPCEGSFRDVRSCTSTFHTAVNVSVNECIKRYDKIERITENRHSLSRTLVMPRHHKKMKEQAGTADQLNSLISDCDLLKAITEAKGHALRIAEDLGMRGVLNMDPPLFVTNMSKKNQRKECQDQYTVSVAEDEGELDASDEVPAREDENDTEMPLDVAEDIFLHNESSLDLEPHEASPFVAIEEDGKRKVMKKTTFLWLMTSKKHSLSSSRTERVKAALEVLENQSMSETEQVRVAENLSLGEWAIFKNCPLPNRLYVGRILDFSYLTGSGKARQYTDHSAPLAEPQENARGIGFMADLYTVSLQSGCAFVKFHEPHAYHNLNDYICTIPRPDFVNGQWACSEDIITAVRKIHNEVSGSCLNTAKKVKTDGTSSSPAPPTKKKHTGRLLFPDSDSDSEGNESDSCSTGQGNKNSPLVSSRKRSMGSTATPPPSPKNRRSDSPSTRSKMFQPLERSPMEEDFVLVEFLVKSKTTYYVARVLKELDEEGDLEVSYLRRAPKTFDKFCLPQRPDLASVHISAVKMILPKPTFDGVSSTRQKGLYKFDVSFDGLLVN